MDIFSTIFGDLEQILGLKLPHPTIGMAWKIIFLPFFKFLLLFGFQMTKYGAEYIHRKVISCAELFSQVSRSTGCQKVEEIWQNAKMLIFRLFAQCSRSLQSARIWSKSLILVIFWLLVGLWYMQKCFPMFVDAIKAFWGAKIGLEQKKSFSSCHP